MNQDDDGASKYEEERIDYLFEKWFAGTDLEKNCDESYPVGWRQSIFRWTFATGYRMGTHENPENKAMSAESQAETARVLVKDIELKEKRITELEDALDKTTSQAWLGNATTRDLLDELQARAEVGGYSNYKTVDEK